MNCIKQFQKIALVLSSILVVFIITSVLVHSQPANVKVTFSETHAVAPTPNKCPASPPPPDGCSRPVDSIPCDKGQACPSGMDCANGCSCTPVKAVSCFAVESVEAPHSSTFTVSGKVSATASRAVQFVKDGQPITFTTRISKGHSEVGGAGFSYSTSTTGPPAFMSGFASGSTAPQAISDATAQLTSAFNSLLADVTAALAIQPCDPALRALS